MPDTRITDLKNSNDAALAAKRAEVAGTAEREAVANDKIRTMGTEDAISVALALDATLTPPPTALSDIKRRALKASKLSADGSTVLFGEGAQTASQWLTELKSTAPHLLGKPAPGSIAGVSRSEFDTLPAKDRLKLARQAGL